MGKPDQKTKKWINLTIKASMRDYVTWAQFGIVLGIVSVVISFLFGLILKLHGVI